MLAHSYPGNSFRDWVEMPIDWLRAHADALPELQAADQMRAFQANAFAWMKPAQQRQLTRDLQRASKAAKAPQTIEEMIAMTRATGGTVIREAA